MTRGSSFRFFAAFVIIAVIALAPVSSNQKTSKGQQMRPENLKKRAGNSTKTIANIDDDVKDNNVIRDDAKTASRSAGTKAGRAAMVANAVKSDLANAQQAEGVSNSTSAIGQQRRNKGNVTKRPRSHVSGSGSDDIRRGEPEHENKKNRMENYVKMSRALQKSVNESLTKMCSRKLVQSNWAEISTESCQRHYEACSTVYQLLPLQASSNSSSLEKPLSAVEEMRRKLDRTRNMVRKRLEKEGCTAKKVTAEPTKTILHCPQSNSSDTLTALATLHDEINNVIMGKIADLLHPGAIPPCKSKPNRKAQKSPTRQKKEQPRNQLMEPCDDVTDVENIPLLRLGLYCMDVMQYAKLEMEAVFSTLQHCRGKDKQNSPAKHVQRKP